MKAILEMGAGQNHISAVPSQRNFSAVVIFCSGMMLHRGGSCFSSSIWSMLSSTMEEVARFGVTFCV